MYVIHFWGHGVITRVVHVKAPMHTRLLSVTHPPKGPPGEAPWHYNMVGLRGRIHELERGDRITKDERPRSIEFRIWTNLPYTSLVI